MSSVFFELETLNPNLRTTYFKHRQYTEYIANSKFAIINPNVEHGLFGRIKEFENIEKMQNVDLISRHITDLAENKVPIYRGIISLSEYDAERLEYYEQEKWKNLLENRLPSISEKLNIKYEDLQYVGAVHIEEGHPHLQFMLWSKGKEKSNYFVKYQIKNALRKEFINDVYRNDLLHIYQEKDLVKKNITSENYILTELKKITKDEKLLNELFEYERNFSQTKKIKSILKDKELRKITNLLMDLKEELRNVQGSIKYQYLLNNPGIIKKIDNISNMIIEVAPNCKKEIEKYIKLKQQIKEFQYTDNEKIKQAKEIVKQETEKEILKLIGNQILDIERKFLNANTEYTKTKYSNETRNLIDKIFSMLYFQSYNQKKYNKNYELYIKKQLSNQAKKEIALNKRNASEFNWEN